MDAVARPALTYAPHGGSLNLEPHRVPAGFRVFRHEAVIGAGAERWASASAEVLEWGMQRGAGIRVNTPRVVVGDDVTLTIPLLGIVPVTARTRVLAIVDEPSRRGFVYGTLPGHPERGEEAFLVTIDNAGVVRAAVHGFSRPAPGIWMLGAPVLRLVQAIYTRRYLRALARGAH
ncbi:DUF1990 family protein [Microcella humidisoli]|uniref:DUF1990 domain-containing protein n=1 Tax=Microcella humidisoli TaxID=2963406 RepID=A0ABY5FXC8_9MICO|nr:DUF1990 domain-containing protein [Microcella humidisoli]UTT62525.1 DUF1990 domain-containing protein [Microcella humidisoli]